MNDLMDYFSDNKSSVLLPKNACIITFDDGHKGNFNLLPIFKIFSIKPLIYLCSQIICTNRHFWWKEQIVSASKLKNMTNSRFLTQIKIECGYEPEKEFSDRHALNAFELKELSPYVLFGSHSRYHPILINCTDSECFNEINESKNDLEELLGVEISHFAYPNGDFTDREIEFVRMSNYKTARSIKYGFVNHNPSSYSINGIEIDDHCSISILCAELIGLNSILKTFIKKIWNYSDD
jgi:peptidoglycan/xylan/chitin deacetylase (PgdA/CDA1 family)